MLVTSAVSIRHIVIVIAIHWNVPRKVLRVGLKVTGAAENHNPGYSGQVMIRLTTLPD